MGCCGEKRKQLRKSHLRQTSNHINTEVKPKPDRIFEYKGSGSLRIKGSATGTVYNFRKKGDRQKIDHYDSFSLMAEYDLVLLSS